MKVLKFIALTPLIFPLASCGGSGSTSEAHVHNFNQQVASEDYLASAASCTEVATYYYSCSCGEKGEETFAYGSVLPHSYDFKGICSACGDDVGIEVNTSTTFGTSSKEDKYYHFTAMQGSYNITYIGDPQTINVYDEEGTVVCSALDTDFSTSEAIYYIVVAKSETNSGSLRLVNTGHVHNYDYKGSCTVEGCDVSCLIELASWSTSCSPHNSNTYYCYTSLLPAGKYKYTYTASKPKSISVADADGNVLASDFSVEFTIAADNTRFYALILTGSYYTNSVSVQAVAQFTNQQ